MKELIGISAALVSTLTWAIGTVKLKEIGEKASPITMTLVKSIYCALVLVIIALVTRNALSVKPEFLLTLIASGVIGIAIGDCLFFASLKRLSPVVLSVILLAGPDIATGLLSFIILKEVPSVLTLVGIVGTLLGLRFIIFPVKEEGGKSKISGYIFAFGALICMAVSTVMIKPVLNDISTVTVTIYRLLFGGIALLFYTALTGQTGDYLLPFKDKPFRKTYFSVMSLVAIGGFWLSIEAFKNINLITASALMTLEPLFILLIMILFYRYKPLKNELFGIIITLIGVLMIGYGEIL